MRVSHRKSIAIIAPALPPKLDGIGDHSARLGRALVAAGASVTILGPRAKVVDPVEGVRIVPAFDPPDDRRSVWDLVPLVAQDRPDWVVLQYNPFAYGRRGLNLSLPRAYRAMRRASSGTRLALFAHEEFVLCHDLKHVVMTTWQRWQFRQLGRTSDVLFSSTGAWADADRKRFPKTPVVHMPVGSNVPRVSIDRAEARRRLGIGDGVGVIGLFGTAHASRLAEPVRHALRAASEAGLKPLLLYVGPHAGTVRQAFPDQAMIAEGPLDADEVSRRLSAVDVYAGSFIDGVSTRRGSWLAALQHGLACVGTRGSNTDRVFRDADGVACVLADALDPRAFGDHVVSLLADPARRETIGQAAAVLYRRELSWDTIADRMLNVFNSPASRHG